MGYERLLKELKTRRSKAEDTAEGYRHKAGGNDYYYNQGIADGIEIAEMIVRKIEREEREEK